MLDLNNCRLNIKNERAREQIQTKECSEDQHYEFVRDVGDQSGEECVSSYDEHGQNDHVDH